MRVLRILAVLGVTGLLAACGGYPREARYSIYVDPPTGSPPLSEIDDPRPPVPTGEGVRGPTNPATEAPLPVGAPVAEIEGGALDAPADSPIDTPVDTRPTYDRPSAAGPASEGFATPPPPARNAGPARPGARYEIQPGDTISGIGRRFQTPVQVLIDLNNLGPRAAITPGQRIILPEGAVDVGGDPYATGPSPTGAIQPEDVAAPPPPPPPPPPANAVPPPSTTAPPATSVALDWPVRGDILRRFGPVGMGERNNGINIGGAQGDAVRASAAGRVGYVGDDLAGQGLTVLIVHRDGWRTVYGHLGQATVRDGEEVTAGQQIGTVGTTAGDGRPSIHFETWRMRGDEPNAIDPLTVLPR